MRNGRSTPHPVWDEIPKGQGSFRVGKWPKALLRAGEMRTGYQSGYRLAIGAVRLPPVGRLPL